MDWLSTFEFDLVSFLLGFFIAVLLSWVFRRLMPLLPLLITLIRTQIAKYRQSSLEVVDQFLRLEVQKRAQASHLASPIFALEEVLIEPRFLVQTESNVKDPHSSKTLASTTIPFILNLPDVTSQYPYPTISLPQATQNGSNLAVLAPAGSGKTVALAHLALLHARRDPSLTRVKFPVFAHAQEFIYPEDNNVDPLGILIQLLVSRSSGSIQKRIPALIKSLQSEGDLLLILDGLDELPPQQFSMYIRYIKSLNEKYPDVQIIISASLTFLDGILQNGFQPLSLAAWSHFERVQFTRKWQEHWTQKIASSSSDASSKFDAAILLNWIDLNTISLTPLEWTLKVWSLFSGDLTGNTNLNAIHAYIDRSIKSITSIEAVQNLAAEFSSSQRTSATYAQVEKFLARGSSDSKALADTLAQKSFSDNKRKLKTISSTSKVINSLLVTGFLREWSIGTLSLSHPVILAYLASFTAPEPELLSTYEKIAAPSWEMDDLVQHYMASQGKLSEYIDNLIVNRSQWLHQNLIRVSRWLKDAPANIPWRSQVIKQLIYITHQNNEPLYSKAHLLFSIACSNDPSVTTLFRQLHISQSVGVRQLAALCSGALQDFSALENLTNLLADDQPQVQACAAYAISILQSARAQSIADQLLRSGDEALSQASAECMAQDSAQGHPLLKSAIESDQILVRRAAILGLAQINQDWVMPIIEKVAIQDAQWVVRNVAGQALETLKSPRTYVPSRLPPAHASDWLLHYASKLDEGIPVGSTGYEILMHALQNGSAEQKIAAIDYLRTITTEDTVSILQATVFDQNLEVAQAAANSLWLINLMGKQTEN